jgi:acetyl-CoA C-acetyltransferase
MSEAYIVAAQRTAGGRRGGLLRDWHPADLAGKVLDALVEKTGVDPALIEAAWARVASKAPTWRAMPC